VPFIVVIQDQDAGGSVAKEARGDIQNIVPNQSACLPADDG